MMRLPEGELAHFIHTIISDLMGEGIREKYSTYHIAALPRKGGRPTLSRHIENKVCKETWEVYLAISEMLIRLDYPVDMEGLKAISNDYQIYSVGDGNYSVCAEIGSRLGVKSWHSVDPLAVQRDGTSGIYPSKIEDLTFYEHTVVILLIHSHVGIGTVLESFPILDMSICVTIPCCYRLDTGYTDQKIHESLKLGTKEEKILTYIIVR